MAARESGQPGQWNMGETNYRDVSNVTGCSIKRAEWNFELGTAECFRKLERSVALFGVKMGFSQIEARPGQGGRQHASTCAPPASKFHKIFAKFSPTPLQLFNFGVLLLILCSTLARWLVRPFKPTSRLVYDLLLGTPTHFFFVMWPPTYA
jgi:hypothetical protein